MVSRADSSAAARSLISTSGEGGISKRRWLPSTAGAADESAPIDPEMRAPTKVASPTAIRTASRPPAPITHRDRWSDSSNEAAGSAEEEVPPVDFERANAKYARTPSTVVSRIQPSGADFVAARSAVGPGAPTAAEGLRVRAMTT